MTSLTEKNTAVVRQYLSEIVSRGDLSVIDQLVSSRVVFTSPYTPEPIQGIEGFKQMIQMLHTAFPDMQLVEQAQVAEGDLVASRWVVSGTHSGDFMGYKPSGRRYEITGMSFYRLADGKIVEGWVNDDSLGMLRQLGIL